MGWKNTKTLSLFGVSDDERDAPRQTPTGLAPAAERLSTRDPGAKFFRCRLTYLYLGRNNCVLEKANKVLFLGLDWLDWELVSHSSLIPGLV